MSDDPQHFAELLPPDEATVLGDAELKALMARAKDGNDESLRRLLVSYITLRRLAADMVTFIETREGAQTIVRSTLFNRVRDLTRRPAK